MAVIPLRDIEKRVYQNSIKFKDTIDQVTSEIKNKNLKKVALGRETQFKIKYWRDLKNSQM